MKCIYTDAHDMGNKQEKLEANSQQENYDIVAITETWGDDLHNPSAARDDYHRMLGWKELQGPPGAIFLDDGIV